MNSPISRQNILANQPIKRQSDRQLHRLFEQRVNVMGDAIAVVFADGEACSAQLSYRELNQKANQLARYLITNSLKANHEIKPDTLVGIKTKRSLEMVIGIMAVLKAGGAYVPLDPRLPPDRLSYMLEDAALDVVLSQTNVSSILACFNGTVVHMDGLVSTDEHCCATYDKGNLDTAQLGLDSSNLAYVIYTSGSTGQPKGVLTEHRSLLNYGEGFVAQTDLCRNDVESGWLWLPSFNFDASLKGIYLLSRGVKLIVPSTQAAATPADIAALVKRHNIGIINTTPQLLALIVKEPELPNVDLISGGEAIGAGTLRLFKQFVRRAKTTLINAYGPTESTINSSFAVITPSDQEMMGRPVGNTVFYVLNQDLTLVPK
ncbi:MAG: AMP-binding protein, partial [Psychrosphaera sp.]|nr:AMP-binding protein [Psychrosphaera sp.]